MQETTPFIAATRIEPAQPFNNLVTFCSSSNNGIWITLGVAKAYETSMLNQSQSLAVLTVR